MTTTSNTLQYLEASLKASLDSSATVCPSGRGGFFVTFQSGLVWKYSLCPSGVAKGTADVFYGPGRTLEGLRRHNGTLPKEFAAMATAAAWASYSPSRRLRVGAVIMDLNNTSVLAIGYNGDEKGGHGVPMSTLPGAEGFVHAEENALIKLRSREDAALYVTHSPCLMCAKKIINADSVKVVYYVVGYRDMTGIGRLIARGIQVYQLVIPGMAQEQLLMELAPQVQLNDLA